MHRRQAAELPYERSYARSHLLTSLFSCYPCFTKNKTNAISSHIPSSRYHQLALLFITLQYHIRFLKYEYWQGTYVAVLKLLCLAFPRVKLTGQPTAAWSL